MENKCYGCTKRECGCHSKCSDYAEFRQRVEAKRKSERSDDVQNIYRKDAIGRMQNRHLKHFTARGKRL